MRGGIYSKLIRSCSLISRCGTMFSSLSSRVLPEIKLRDMIKPSSPTPKSHKSLKLSFVDQFAPRVYIPLIFFYKCPVNDENYSKKSILLKKSLSETLTHFYPLAGQVEGNSSVNCNDEGIEYSEANVPANLSEFLMNPNPNELTKLLPFTPAIHTSVMAGVQVNHFSCRSVAVSICVSHKIADGATVSAFVNAWAAKARGYAGKDENVPQVIFDAAASLYPPKDWMWIDDLENYKICKEKIVTRRLIFDKEKLNMLKRQYIIAGSRIEPPTKAEAVSAFIWKRVINGSKTKVKPPKYFGALQVINLRSVPSSPIPENWYGNLSWFASANALVKQEIEYPKMISKLRAAEKQIDKNYSKKIKTGECTLEIQMVIEKSIHEVEDFFTFSGCTGLPLYEANFGWGKPIWVSMTSLPLKNMVFLLSTKCGEGVEAWVNMLESEISMLDDELHPPFLSITSP